LSVRNIATLEAAHLNAVIFPTPVYYILFTAFDCVRRSEGQPLSLTLSLSLSLMLLGLPARDVSALSRMSSWVHELPAASVASNSQSTHPTIELPDLVI
jgi:hypothetical protein